MRFLAGLLAAALLWLAAAPASALDRAVWDQAKARLVDADGRVVDRDNGGVSHSEGQGYAMILAEAAGDRAGFEQLWAWTERHLARHDLRLFAWKFDPAAAPQVAESNNATDGDILIAWALLRAAERWGVPAYAAAAADIRSAIRLTLVRRVAGRAVLLPGLDGFETEGAVVLNPSYLIVPALKAFAQAEPAAGWDILLRDGLALLRDARFGRFALNPDWLRLAPDGALAPAPARPARFGYDAIRIPLYLVWGGEGGSEPLAPMTALWRDLAARNQALPGWVDLWTGAFADYPAPEGGVMIARLALGGVPPAPPGAGESYYSTMLALLAMVAADEQGSAARKAQR